MMNLLYTSFLHYLLSVYWKIPSIENHLFSLIHKVTDVKSY